MAEKAASDPKRPKRTYRACFPCRSRKLKCSFGDPNSPWDGPCERCMREQRDCERGKPRFVPQPAPRKTDQFEEAPVAGTSTAHGHSGSRGYRGGSSRDASPPRRLPDQPLHARRRSASPYHPAHGSKSDTRPTDSDDDSDPRGGDALVSSNLQNPNDALRLLASASSLEYRNIDIRNAQQREQRSAGRVGNNAAMWASWEPIQSGLCSVQTARTLFSFFELEMAPLYPLIHPTLFEPHYLQELVKGESVLLGTIIAIAARYSSVLGPLAAEVHALVSQWVRVQLLGIMDGDPSLRGIATVEAMLLLSEWPMLPMNRGVPDSTDTSPEEATLLKPSQRYDAYSWMNIGMAVRLAQELGIHDVVALTSQPGAMNTWKEERMLKTWVYCYNADRHLAVRLGRNAVLQEAMTSRWWEGVAALVTTGLPGSAKNVWTSDAYTLGGIAQLMATIQDHLYPNNDVTRSLLRTGAWESFLRSFRLEIRHTKRSCHEKLDEGSLDSALLGIELDYVVLYAYSLALRALQGKLRRRRAVGDMSYHAPTLLNMVEGPWIMEALTAARSIVELTLNILEQKQILRYCPSRIFQYILFATTFLYKALATGMVEHGESNIAAQLESLVDALSRASIDSEHFLAGFAELIKRLGKHWRTSSANSTSPSILNRPPSTVISPNSGASATATPQPSTQPRHQPRMPMGTVPADKPGDGTVNLNTLAFPAPQTSSPPGPPDLSNMLSNLGATNLAGDDFQQWNFDPTLGMPAADHEQDVLFQSIWDSTHTDAAVSASNLYATLLGDVFELS